MKLVMLAATVTLLTAAPLLAQTERGFVTGAGGFAVTTDTTSGDAIGEAGIRIAPHLLVFGDVGRFRNLQPSDTQPAVDSTTTSLFTTRGLSVTGTGRVPAWYSVGGLRYEIPTRSRLSPYVSGGLGFARLTPTAQFTYSSGPLNPGFTNWFES